MPLGPKMLNDARKNLSNLLSHIVSWFGDETLEAISKIADCGQWQGVPWVESGAYTGVREHFKSRDNTASGR